MNHHRKNCNFKSGEACICPRIKAEEIGFESHILEPAREFRTIPLNREVEIPTPNDNAIRISCRVYSRLGEH